MTTKQALTRIALGVVTAIIGAYAVKQLKQAGML